MTPRGRRQARRGARRSTGVTMTADTRQTPARPRTLRAVAAATALAAIQAGCATPAPAWHGAASADAAAASDGGVLEDAGALADGAAASDGAGDAATAGDPDATGVDAGPGPSCAQALTCVVKARKALAPDVAAACTAQLSESEGQQMAALMTCTEGACKTPFEAWANGGLPADEAAVYTCLIEKCPSHLAICIGGHGQHSCPTALACLGGCPPNDSPCTIKCLESTSEPQALKTGNYLSCLFATCTLATAPTCPVKTSCGIKCFQ